MQQLNIQTVLHRSTDSTKEFFKPFLDIQFLLEETYFLLRFYQTIPSPSWCPTWGCRMYSLRLQLSRGRRRRCYDQPHHHADLNKGKKKGEKIQENTRKYHEIQLNTSSSLSPFWCPLSWVVFNGTTTYEIQLHNKIQKYTNDMQENTRKHKKMQWNTKSAKFNEIPLYTMKYSQIYFWVRFLQHRVRMIALSPVVRI